MSKITQQITDRFTSFDFGDVPRAEVFRILSSDRRVLFLRAFEYRECLSRAEIADISSSIDLDKPIEQVSGSERKKYYVGFMQQHADRLVACKALRVSDSRDDMYYRGENYDEFMRLLRLFEESSAYITTLNNY